MADEEGTAKLLGRALRKIRKDALLSRPEAAKAVGVSLRTLDTDERGDAEAGVSAQRVDQYALLYGTTPREILLAAATCTLEEKAP